MKHLSFILVLLSLVAGPTLCSQAALAVDNPWVPIGPPGGQVDHLLVHPRNPQILWAGTISSGVYKSVDGGVSWNPVNQGLDRLAVHALAVAPGNPQILYAAAGGRFYGSSNGGETWTVRLPCGNQPGCLPLQRVLDLVVDPRRPQTVFALTFRGLFRSADGGVQWQRVPRTSRSLVRMYFEPENPKVAYATGFHELYKSTDGGASWKLWSQQGTHVFEHLAIDPKNPRRMWTVSSSGVFRSTDGGRSWRSLDPTLRATALALAPAAGSRPPVLWIGNPDGVLRSLDGGVTWTVLLPNRWGAAIATHPSQPGTLWVGTIFMGRAASGVFKSVNRGASWTFSSRGIFNVETYSVAFDPVTPGVLWAYTAQTGIWRSGDGGSTWTERNGNLSPDLPITALEVGSDGAVWAGTDNGVFITEDGGVTWEERREGLSASPDALPFARVFFLRLAPSDPSVAYVGSNPKIVVPGSTPRLFKTEDTGRSWGQTAAAPFLPSAILDVWVDPRDPDVLFAVWGGLWVSQDAGSSWTWVPVGETVSLSSVEGDPQDPDVLYVLSDRGLFRSADGGKVWQQPVDLPAGAQGAFVVGPAGEVWVQSPDRLYVSPDGIAGWAPLPELPGPLFLFAADPHHPGTVFISASRSDAHGVVTGLFRHVGD